MLLGVTGSVAAYKAAELARLMLKRGYKVRVVMTKSAAEFVGPLTFEAITGVHVISDFFNDGEIVGNAHIECADWADIFLIAPGTANIISKIAQGSGDCAISSVALATAAPLVIAPAMNVNMWENPATQENIGLLQSRGITIVAPDKGDLACGWQGQGRFAHPWEIFHVVRRTLSAGDYFGKRVLITAGPTRETIDPVRFVSNRSSGKMGVALAREAYRRGADVTLVHGPVRVKVPRDIQKIEIGNSKELASVMNFEVFESETPPDIVIMAAAVADYRPKEVFDEKIKKANFPTKIEMIKNPDILAELGEKRADAARPVLVGFAVETGEIDELLVEVRSKLERKNADMIVGNLASEALELDTNRVWLIDKNGKQQEISTSFKSRVANKILDRAKKL